MGPTEPTSGRSFDSGLTWYLLGRLAWTGVATLTILTVTFVLMDVIPDQRLLEAEFYAAQQGTALEDAAGSVTAQRGLDQPAHVRYVEFLASLAQGNWGWSHEYEAPVRTVITQTVPYTLLYALPAAVLATGVGVAVGLAAAVTQHSVGDRLVTVVAFVGLSIPSWWFGIVTLVVFGSLLGWVDVGWNADLPRSADGGFTWLERADDTHPAFVGESVTEPRYVGILSPANLTQLVLPTLVLAFSAAAAVTRYVRAEALEYVDRAFVKTARAKGISTRKLVIHHVFRPAAVPLTSVLVGRILGLVLAGSYLIEVVFGIPGIGLAAFEAMRTQDHDLVLVTILIPTVLVLLGTLLEDVSYALLDPRIGDGDR